MNFSKNPFLLLFFINLLSFGQKNANTISGIELNSAIASQNSPNESNIIKSSLFDSAFVKIELKNGFYDFEKNNLPYYILSKVTNDNESAKPTLVTKKIQPVSEPHASAIKKYYLKYLSPNFEVKEFASISVRQNLNHNRLLPFRLNALGQIEELVDYDVNWQLLPNSKALMRGTSTSSFTTTSVLSTGTWYKIGVTQTGIHKINKVFLSNLGVDVANLDPKNIRIYGNGGKMLPERNIDFRNDDLVENAIQIVDNGNTIFENNEYVLFYATGPTEWKKNKTASKLKFEAVKNLYSDTSFYFINVDLGAGKRVTTIPASALTSNVSSNSYDYYNYHEENISNFIKSGRHFYGEYFDVQTAYTFNWNDGNFATNDSIFVEAIMAARNKDITQFLVNGNGLNFTVTTNAVNVDYYLGDYGSVASNSKGGLNIDPSTIGVTISKLTSNSLGWLDKITVNARRELKLNTKQFQYRDSRVSGLGKVCNFTINFDGAEAPIVWNVTNPLNPFVQSVNVSGNSLSYNAATDSLMEFSVSPLNDLYTPIYVGEVPNQNLHAIMQADYVIITHPLFLSQSQRLADLHKTNDNLTYAIATTDQVYNEFSSGKQDISAIRDFIRMIYSRNIAINKQVKYVALMGDGSYVNKQRGLVNNSNLIPTYQSNNSMSPTSSMATDDFYGLMDDYEGANAEGYGSVDIGVGRLTCRNTAEMSAVLAKIENYYKKDPNFQVSNYTPENFNSISETTMGDWRNWLLFVADDKDNGIHMDQSNKLTYAVRSKSQLQNIDKVFLDAYQRFSTPGGKRYPDATADFLKRIKKGTLIFNYTGHGGEVGLGEERILDVPTINAMDNFSKLPLFITATCEFSRYDDPGRTSAGELCLLNPKGGAIALYTTCRVAYSTPNYSLNEDILKRLFTRNVVTNKYPNLGDVIRQTKALLTQSIYFANFHLLGDPALHLAYPEQNIITSQINSVPTTTLSSDTLSALSKITITGFVADAVGNKLSNFNGIVYPSVFDKERNAVCLVNDPESAVPNGTLDPIPFVYTTQKNILYRGKSQVVNGDFSFTFIVPKDISFSPGQGKINYYATNGAMDAGGSYSNIIIGGNSSKNAIIDNEGPQINLFLNSKNFVPGGLTSEAPILYANLFDSSGINTVGNGIGHDISVILDANSSNPLILNDFYEANLNSYQSGLVRYPYNNLSEGPHTLTFKVWDIQNNSSLANTDFVVAKSGELALKHVLNYPNPFTTQTKFFFEHNQAFNQLKVTIQIYTISGKVVKTIQRSLNSDSYRSDGIDWDGKDDYGDKLGRGVYIYKLAVLDVNNKKAEKIEKLVILN